PKERDRIICLLGSFKSSSSIQGIPLSSNTVRSPTTVICFFTHVSLAFLRSRAVNIQFRFSNLAYCLPIPHISSTLTLERKSSNRGWLVISNTPPHIVFFLA